MADIGIAIIGHGFMGHEHETMLCDFPGIRLVGISDRDPEQLEDVKEGIKRYTSNEALFADPEVDVVLIAANNNQHHDLVLQAAAAKKDIICEKPVAMSLPELDDMEKAVKEAGVKFTVHQQRRYDPDYTTAKAVYDSKTLGEIYSVKTMLYGRKCIAGDRAMCHVWRTYMNNINLGVCQKLLIIFINLCIIQAKILFCLLCPFYLDITKRNHLTSGRLCRQSRQMLLIGNSAASDHSNL